ncbi:hypothetical protein LJC60_10505, partial [Ruminococcaceae bacterium OttesenSCG-928-D13]|nr:hypothetical protein [Ruminococcaceae bacterium OttesenSCG-928-D13]
TPAQFGRLLANLSAVLRAYRTMPTWPTVPTMPVNSFEKVNDIERLIHLSRTAWDADRQNALYCGEGAAGETIGVI